MKINPHVLSRTTDWWKPKVGNILGIVYIAIFEANLTFGESWPYIFPSILTILGIGFFAHLTNDWFDRKTDFLANKKNMLAQASPIAVVGYFIGSVVMIFLPWIWLPADSFSWSLLTLELILVVIYSTPPIRLKTKGMLGLICDALYAYTVPAALAYYTFMLLVNEPSSSLPDGFEALLFWQFAVGIYNITIHQIEDVSNDRKTNTTTVATRIGAHRLQRYTILSAWPLSITGFLVFVFSLKNSFIFVSCVGLIIMKLIYLVAQKKPMEWLSSPFVEDLQRLNVHYHRFFPHLVLILLIYVDPLFCWLAVFHLVVFSIDQFSPLWHIGKKLAHIYLIHPIYYYAVEFGILKPKQKTVNRTQTEAQETVKNGISIAVMNRNKDKYTETFVRRKVEVLEHAGYDVHFLFGDNLPTESVRYGTLLSNYKTIRYVKKWFYALMDKPETELNERALKSYLLNNNIQLVLAEFGTVGVEVGLICKALGIPFIVTFYGYDLHHEHTFRAHRGRYIDVLQDASLVFGVSKEITEKLAEVLPNVDVRYRPCLMNAQLFSRARKFVDNSSFLSIGRFAETKAPHLTILAFNEVLKTIPDAKLTMIGKDGGGELFEAAIILVQALGISHAVDFKGIQTPAQILEIIKETRVFVQHSITTPLHGDKEGTPVAIMEAMAAGMPVVATRHAGILDLIDHEKTGLLIDEYDWQGMSEAMIRLATYDELAINLGERAAERIQNDPLIWQGMGVFLNDIQEVLSKKHKQWN
jgi:glycosyltransferase involved in cell wall biosynthesis